MTKFSYFTTTMNSATKFIFSTMVITYWQFPLVQTSPTLGELLDKENTNYQALELNAHSKLFLFRYRDDQYQKDKSSDPSLKFLYFCPSQQDWHTEFNNKMERSSLFLVEISNERKTIRCKKQIIPFLTRDYKKKCGTNNQGTEHSLSYQLYYPSNYMKQMGWKSISMTQYQNLAKGTLTDANLYLTFVIIYRFCFYHDSHETAFASYMISSLGSKESQIPRNFDTRLTENNDQRLFGLDDAPLCYKKENQSFGLDFESNVGDDYLVEQMLVPWDEIVEDIERGTTKNYTNVSPQWKSLREDWNSLNQYFKSLPIKRVMCGTYGKFEHIRLGKTLVDEEQQQEMPPDQLHDSNTFKKPNLTLTVPVYWWKLVVFSENTGIVLIMPNYPKDVSFPSDTITPLCEDVCDRYKWTGVKTINATIVCCRPKAELIAKLLSSSPADIPEDISSLAPASNPDASVLKRLWASFTDLWLNTD